jgi:hypothetical protein
MGWIISTGGLGDQEATAGHFFWDVLRCVICHLSFHRTDRSAKLSATLRPMLIPSVCQVTVCFCIFVCSVGWGRTNGVPLLRVPIVQQFICQDGDLPAPDRNISIPRLIPEHLRNAELKQALPPSGLGGGGMASKKLGTPPKLPSQAFSSPPGSVRAPGDGA